MHYLMFSEQHRYPMIECKSKLSKLSWISGRFLEEPPTEPLIFEFDATPESEWVDFIRPAPNVPLCSERMRSALEQAGVDNIDYYEAFVLNRTAGESRHYYAANIIGLVKMVDYENSVLDYDEDDEDEIDFIKHLVLDSSRAQGGFLFRLAEFQLLIVVEEHVRNYLEQRGLEGILWMQPEEWDGLST